jgi:hypothetical protein
MYVKQDRVTCMLNLAACILRLVSFVKHRVSVSHSVYPVFCIVLFVLSNPQFVSAQVYPVQGNTVLIPPYSAYLADYTSRSTDRLVLNVVLHEVTRPELAVRLRLRIEGQNVRIETKPEYIGSRLTLQGGIPLRLNGVDLTEYFNPANLNFSGITRKEFEKSGKLPQGFYQFCFEVLEYDRGIKISNTICGPGWLILNDPPIVNLPKNNEKIKATVPQNVIFQWTPRHTGSPNSAFSTEYELKMVEMWPATRNPNDAVLTSPPILETTTRSTSFIYGPSETPLELGRRYAFRIKAKSMVGVDEYDLFKNNGYSEVISFVYGDACGMPANFSAKSTSPSTFRAQWDGQFNHTAFQVRYRESGVSSAQWFSSNSFVNEVEISSLKSNTTYEVQVAGSCGSFESLYTIVATVKTGSPPLASYSCGLPVQNFNLDPSSLIGSLTVGDIIHAGDFDVQLTKVRGSNGTFSGEGIVIVPFLNNVKVKTVFADISVNRDSRMVKGYMNVSGAALDVIPDQVTALMDQLNGALDEIEEALNKAEDVVNQIDNALDQAQQVIDKIAAYLPDDILNEIKDAKAAIAQAKTELKDADTPAKMEEAKAELKKSREKMKDAAGKALEYYAKAVKDFVKILKESLQELVQENTNQKDRIEQDLATADANLKRIEDESALRLFGVAPATESQEVNKLVLVTWEQGTSATSDAVFEKAASEYLALERKRNILHVILLFAGEYNSETKLKELGETLKAEGESVLHFIAQKLKERKSVSEIKTKVKEILVVNISGLIYKN